MRRWLVAGTCADPEVKTGGPDPLPWKSQSYLFTYIRNTGPDPLENHNIGPPSARQ